MVDARDTDERVSFEVVVEALLRGSLVQVVELAEDALLEVAHDGAGLQPPRDHAAEADHEPDVRQVVLDRVAHAGVLHLHGDRRAIGELRAMHLPNGCGGERLALKVAKDVGRLRAVCTLENVLDQRVSHGRRIRLERCELRRHLVRQHAGHQESTWPTS